MAGGCSGLCGDVDREVYVEEVRRMGICFEQGQVLWEVLMDSSCCVQ